MSTATSANDEAVTLDEAAEAFRKKYPNWQQNHRFSEVFSRLEYLTRIDDEHTAEPEKIFTCFLDQSKISISEAQRYTGRLELEDWFVIFAFFADCNIQHFSKRFNKLTKQTSDGQIPLSQLKDQLTKDGKVMRSEKSSASKSTSLKNLELTEDEEAFLQHCINSLSSDATVIRLKGSGRTRRYRVVGKAGPFTKKAVKVISCSRETVYNVRKALSDRDLLWIEGGKESRKRGKRIAIWEMLL